MSRLRVIVIDPVLQSVSEAYVETLQDMQEIVGGYIERALITDDGTNHELYVNEEGLFDHSLRPFTFEGSRQPLLMGRGFLIGPVNQFGENLPATLTVEEVRAMVGFPDIEVYEENPSMAGAPDSRRRR